MIKEYKKLSDTEKAIYQYSYDAFRCHSTSSFGLYQKNDGAWTSDVISIIWAVITPTGKPSKTKWQYLRFDMRKYTMKGVIVTTKAFELYKLPKGYKWTEPVMLDW